MSNTKSNTKKVRREVYHSDQLGFKELCTIGRYNYNKAYGSLNQHEHSGAFEICYLAKGQQIYQIGQKQYHLRGGDIFITFPDEQHGSGRNPEGKGELFWIIFMPPQKKSSWLGLDNNEAGNLLKALFSLEQRHFRGTADMKELLDAAFEMVREEQGGLSRLSIANRVIAFIIRVAEEGSVKKKASKYKPFGNVLEFIDANIDERLSVPDLSLKTGLSVSRFKFLFKKFFGVPPAEFVLRRKIDRAEYLLSQGSGNVTQIAFRLGFPSSQYFATAFKRFTGKSPCSFLPVKKLS